MARVHVIGNACVDVTLSVSALPQPGESLLAGGQSVGLGGKGLNQAIMVRRSGALVSFTAALGDDAHGRAVRECLARDDVLDATFTRAGPTDASYVLVTADGENGIVTHAQQARGVTADDLRAVLAAVTAGDWLLMQGNLAPEVTAFCLRAARQRRANTALNPSPLFDLRDCLPLLDVLIVNRGESQALGGSTVPLRVVTRGAEGAWLDAGGTSRRVEAPPTPARDTRGAGDVLAGVFVGLLAQGAAPEHALVPAVTAASRKVARAGGLEAFPQAGDIEMTIERGDDGE